MNREAAARWASTNTSYANPIGLDDGRQLLQRRGPGRARRRCCSRTICSPGSSTRRSAMLRSGDHRAGSTPATPCSARAPASNGVKTGHTLGAGYVLVGSASRDGTTADLGRAGRPQRGGPRRRDPGAPRLRLLAVPARQPVKRGEELADPELDYRDERLAAGRQARRSRSRPARASRSGPRSRRPTRSAARSRRASGSVASWSPSTAGSPARTPLVAAELGRGGDPAGQGGVDAPESSRSSCPLGLIVIVVGLLLGAARSRRPRADGDSRTAARAARRAARPRSGG